MTDEGRKEGGWSGVAVGGEAVVAWRGGAVCFEELAEKTGGGGLPTVAKSGNYSHLPLHATAHLALSFFRALFTQLPSSFLFVINLYNF